MMQIANNIHFIVPNFIILSIEDAMLLPTWLQFLFCLISSVLQRLSAQRQVFQIFDFP